MPLGTLNLFPHLPSHTSDMHIQFEEQTVKSTVVKLRVYAPVCPLAFPSQTRLFRHVADRQLEYANQSTYVYECLLVSLKTNTAYRERSDLD